MAARSLAAATTPRARVARLAAPILLSVLALVPAAPAAAAARPGKPAAVATALDGATLTARWTSARGKVQLAVRRPAGAKTKITIKSFAAKPGGATYRLPGAAADRAKVQVRLRRCTGKGKSQKCGRWTGWLTPAAGAVSPSSAGGSATTGTPGSPLTTDGPTIGGCPQMPATWPLNQRIDTLPINARSEAYKTSIGARNLHPDFGAADLGAGPDGFGIPFRIVPEKQAPVLINVKGIPDESDLGSYPIPVDTPVEGGPNAGPTDDRHVLVVEQGTCKLYELGNAMPQRASWDVGVAVTFNMLTGAPRPEGWTSADAAGLPILPLLARYDEVASGRIKHAIRMTVPTSQHGYIAPASHYASRDTDPNQPPMGLRFRLRADYDISRLTGQSKIIAVAMKEYGLVVADNGSGWYVTGSPDRRWNDDDLNQLKGVPGSAFEAVDSGPVVTQAP